MSEFDVKFAAYERAMNANNNFGLKGDAISEQYGRYAVGLQHDETKAAKKKFGREYGKAIAQERAALPKALTGKINEKGLIPLNNRQPLPSMQEVIDKQFGKRQVIDLGFNYTDLSAGQAQLPAPRDQKLLGYTPKADAPITRSDRLLGTGTPARTVNAFKYHNGQYFVLENGKTIGLYNDFSEFNKAVGKLRGQGVKITNEMPYAQTVGDAQRVFHMESKAEAPVAKGQKLLGFTPKAAETPAANVQKLLGSTSKAPVNTAITVAPQSAKIRYSAVFPSANAAEYGKMLAENPLPAKGQIVPFGGGATQKPSANETATKAEKPALSQIQKENVAKPETTATQAEKAENKKATAKGNKRLSNAVINEKVDAYRKAMEKQGLKGQQLEDQVARYKEGLLAERRKHFNKVKGKVKGKNIAKDRAQGKLKVKSKNNNGLFGKIGKIFKGKGGKVAAAALGIAAIGTGLYALFGGKDKKVEETPNIDEPEILTEVPPEDELNEVPESVEESPTVEVPTEYQPIVQLNEDGSYTTKQGDDFFKLAENLLKDYCQVNGIDKEITAYSPEVKYLAEQIMTDNDYWYDFSYSNDRQRPSAPMLHPNITLTIPEIKQFIEKKVDIAA